MTRDDIIRMAEQAGMERCKCEPRCHLHTGGMGSLTYFAKLVAAAEREACAKVCEEPYDLIQITDDCSEYVYKDHLVCADAIRARGLDNLNKEAEQNGEQL
jgi:hypothetical protein